MTKAELWFTKHPYHILSAPSEQRLDNVATVSRDERPKKRCVFGGAVHEVGRVKKAGK